MRVPVCIDGEKMGELAIERRGQWTVLDARLPDLGRVVRLRLYGERGEFYLGVPVPEGEGLRFTRRLSPAEAARLPRRPRYAAESPVSPAEPGPNEDGPAPSGPRHVLWLGGRPRYF